MIASRNHPMMALGAMALLAFGAVTAPAPPAVAQHSLVDDDEDDDPCMTSSRMRQFPAGKGYSNIKLNSPIGDVWQASATKGSQSS